MYVNRKRNRDFTLKEKDKVYLLRQNIKTKRSNSKLDHIKLESFKILKAKKSVNYRLNLLIFMKIHSVFYIFLLKSANSNTFI